jgi:hypothetical protein
LPRPSFLAPLSREWRQRWHQRRQPWQQQMRCFTARPPSRHLNLFALTIASLKAGCRVESSLRNLRHLHHDRFTALQGTHGNPWINQVSFDSDSFPIGIDNHALYCYVDFPHLLDDLVLSNKGSVDGITDGLPIKGKGTFTFTIGDDNGRRNNIRIPKSLYIPGMKKCLLSPQHWAQTAADKKTWMGNFDDCCILF